MADEKKSSGKTIEMRLAEIEDKLAKLHVSEEEIAAYNKVSRMLGSGGGVPVETAPETAAVTANVCTVQQCVMPRQIMRYRQVVPRGPIVHNCHECSCGPCAGYSGGGGGDFGGFGQ